MRSVLNEAFAADPFHAELSPAAFRESYLRGRGFDPALWWLAWDGDELVGFMLAFPEHAGDRVGWLETLAVRPRWRRHGLGEALMRAAILELHTRGFRSRGARRRRRQRRRGPALRAPRLSRRLPLGELGALAPGLSSSLELVPRLPVKKTYKLYVGGKFPRSESGRTYEAEGQNVARASRKDARDAVRAARAAVKGWAGATAYNRGQVIYRVAEMVEARTAEFAELCSGPDEVERTIDRIVWYAGFADKLAQVIGWSNPVGGALLQLHDPGADRRRRDPRARRAGARGDRLAGRAGDRRREHGRGRRLGASPLAAVELAEALATSDVPGGVVNILTGLQSELAPWLAGHMDVNAIDVSGVDGDTAELERLAAENVKRVVRGRADGHSLWEISPFLELKTVWHPIGV